MSDRFEPEDVDLFVGGVEPHEGAAEETVRYIEEYKERPGYAFEVEEARRILAAIGIHAPDYGMQDPEALLDHWRRCVADPRRADADGNGGAGGDHKSVGIVAE